MASYSFGAGDLVLIPTASAIATPVQFNSLQEFSIDFKFDDKTLHGQNQFALDTARSKGTVEGKFKNASVRGALFNSIFFGDTASTGQVVFAPNEAGAVPADSTYTVEVANHATFQTDCGVIRVSDGQPLTKMASASATGQYSVAAGVYTFAAADASMEVMISYTYTTTGTGNTTTLSNKLMGVSPKFKVIYSNVDREGRPIFIQLNSCQSSDMKLATKNEDYTIPEFSFKAMVDAAGNLGITSFPE